MKTLLALLLLIPSLSFADVKYLFCFSDYQKLNALRNLNFESPNFVLKLDLDKEEFGYVDDYDFSEQDSGCSNETKLEIFPSYYLMKCEMPDHNVLIIDKLNRYSLSLEVEEYSLDTNERVNSATDISCFLKEKQL